MLARVLWTTTRTLGLQYPNLARSQHGGSADYGSPSVCQNADLAAIGNGAWRRALHGNKRPLRVRCD